VIDLKYSLVIEATTDPTFFGFYSPDLEGFTGIGHSIEDCLYQAKWGMEEHLELLKEQSLAKLSKSLFSGRNPIWQQAVAKLGKSPAVTELLRQLVAQIPGGQHLLILNKLSDPAARLYYLYASGRFGWSRSVLLNRSKPAPTSAQ
jgi:predicted RNase H-like HicB family nuclease